MEKNNAVCKICGKPYYACMSCADSIKAHPWKAFTDTANCYKVFQVVRGFSSGVYTKDEFKSKLQNIDLSDLDGYREHIKALIKDALKEDEVTKAETTIAEEVEMEEIVVEKPIYSRKRNYKVNKVEAE